MKNRMSSNERLNSIVIIGVLVTANNAMIAAVWGRLPVEVVVSLLALPGMVCSGLIGFIARDVMRSKMPEQEPVEPKEETQ